MGRSVLGRGLPIGWCWEVILCFLELGKERPCKSVYCKQGSEWCAIVATERCL